MNTDQQTTEAPVKPKQNPKAAFLIDQLKIVAKQSVHYKHLADNAKTSLKREYYKKKLGKNNKIAVGILVLLEKEGVEIDKEALDPKE